MEKKQKKQIKIKAKDEDRKGVYSNLMRALYTKEEFLLDFFNVFSSEGMLTTRVILSPGHLKRMVKVLEKKIKEYENKFSSIEETKIPEESIGFKAK